MIMGIINIVEKSGFTMSKNSYYIFDLAWVEAQVLVESAV